MAPGSKKKKGRPVDRLTDDILADIISRVPCESVCRCKCVSRRWRDLIAHPDHRKKMPQTLTGFFYESFDADRFPNKARYFITVAAPRVDPSLSFLPKHQKLAILDCCNGLLLCCHRRMWTNPYEMLYYVVCNPATEKWVVVPTTRWSSEAEIYLAFDPAVSSHFHVCELVEDHVWDSTGEGSGYIGGVAIYSSKAGVWKSLDADAWGGHGCMIPMGAKSVFLRGVLHWCAFDYKLVALDVEENKWKVAPLPTPESHYDASYDLFLSHGQLHFANGGPDELSIWVLEDPSSEIWTMKHSISHLQLFGTEYSAYAASYSVISIHPHENLIFIIAGDVQMLMSYKVDSMKRRIIRQLGSDGQSRWPGWHRVHFIPYVPSFSESLVAGH